MLTLPSLLHFFFLPFPQAPARVPAASMISALATQVTRRSTALSVPACRDAPGETLPMVTTKLTTTPSARRTAYVIARLANALATTVSLVTLVATPRVRTDAVDMVRASTSVKWQRTDLFSSEHPLIVSTICGMQKNHACASVTDTGRDPTALSACAPRATIH